MALNGRAFAFAALLLKHLARETFILYGPPGMGLREVTMEACRAAGFSPRAGQEAPRIASTLSLVAVGLGISLVPASLRDVIARTRASGCCARSRNSSTPVYPVPPTMPTVIMFVSAGCSEF